MVVDLSQGPLLPHLTGVSFALGVETLDGTPFIVAAGGHYEECGCAADLHAAHALQPGG